MFSTIGRKRIKCVAYSTPTTTNEFKTKKDDRSVVFGVGRVKIPVGKADSAARALPEHFNCDNQVAPA
jgi:hypothetical protein